MSGPDVKWGEWLELTDLDAYTGLHFESQPIVLGPLTFVARIVEDLYGKAAGAMGLQVIASAEGIQLAQSEAFGLDLAGFPHEPFILAEVNSLVGDHIHWAQHQAHISIRKHLEESEAQTKKLRELMRVMGTVEMRYGFSNRIRLTLDTAHKLLLFKDKTVPRPFRMELVEESLAVIYNELGQEMGRIGFDPSNEQLRKQVGRFGLYVVTQKEAKHEQERIA
jgi:hypothetical protein